MQQLLVVYSTEVHSIVNQTEGSYSTVLGQAEGEDHHSTVLGWLKRDHHCSTVLGWLERDHCCSTVLGWFERDHCQILQLSRHFSVGTRAGIVSLLPELEDNLCLVS